MLQVHDIRESRVIQEAMKEGAEQVVKQVIPRAAAWKVAPEDIASVLELDVERVRKELAKQTVVSLP